MKKKRKKRISNSACLTKAKTAPTARVNPDSFRVSTRLAITVLSDLQNLNNLSSLSLSPLSSLPSFLKQTEKNDTGIDGWPSSKGSELVVFGPTRPKMISNAPSAQIDPGFHYIHQDLHVNVMFCKSDCFMKNQKLTTQPQCMYPWKKTNHDVCTM